MPDNLLMPEGSDPYYGQRFMPSQTMTAYQPTLRDRLASWLMGDQKASPERNMLVEGFTGSRGMGTTGMGALDWFPPTGVPFAVQDAYRSGDDRALAMALMPGPAKGVTQEAKTATQGIRAYHGSPHDFDKFDMSRIGTGEGAQAYGHGLYFAEAEDVAKQYRKNLSAADGGIDQIAQTLAKQAGGWDKARQKFEGELLGRAQKMRDAGLKYDLPDYDVATLQALRKGEPGRLYEVRINASPDDFLDWDKPLSAQSEKVRGALANDAISPVRSMLGGMRGKRFSDEAVQPYFKGSDLIDDIGENRADAAKRLRDAGIPGIKYLDAGSRTAGEGSRNYVVFDDKIIDIVKKYGIAAAASMYGLDAVNQAMGAVQDQPQNLLMQGY